MPTPTTPTTTLEAVNTLLRLIRVSPINSLLQVDASEDSAEAMQALEAVNREFQTEGWFFNTTEEYQIDPDEDGSITLPANTLRITRSRWKSGADKRLTKRGGRLYCPTGGIGYNIAETVYVDIVECLDYDDLSESARQYVIGLTARRFCLPKLPQQATFAYTEDYVKAARIGVEREDSEERDQSLAATSPHFAKHRRGRREV